MTTPGTHGCWRTFDRAAPLIIPTLTASDALLDGRGSPDAQALLAGLAALKHAIVALLDGIAQSAKLVDTMAVTRLDVYDAHAATIADVSICPILTAWAEKERHPSQAMANPLHLIEIADPNN